MYVGTATRRADAGVGRPSTSRKWHNGPTQVLAASTAMSTKAQFSWSVLECNKIMQIVYILLQKRL